MADDSGGWIKVYWKLKDSVAGSSAVSTGVWIQLLLRASNRTRVLRNGTTINPGEAIISEVGFADDMEVSRKVMRRLINLFESEGMVKVLKRDRNGTHLSICNWGTYQTPEPPKGHKRNSNGTATEHERDSNEHQTKSPKIPKSPEKGGDAPEPSVDELARIESPSLHRRIQTWMAYKAERREGYKPTGLKVLVSRTLNLAKQHGERAVLEAIERAIANGWTGFDHDVGRPPPNGHAKREYVEPNVTIPPRAPQ